MNAEDEIKDRVERIYSLDGPGFPEEVVKSFEYASVSDRIVKIVPDSSVVGMVFETPERCVVVNPTWTASCSISPSRADARG